ncbi:MAG: hypothetical protein HC851_10710 [Acaryochloris sp. RU_4_1]|nr:hypothetical protein [Acaryochloris sp. RU_4_1]NJR56787.1 hypothetical protein [Acaryochloris sp. CRU_2_0]
MKNLGEGNTPTVTTASNSNDQCPQVGKGFSDQLDPYLSHPTATQKTVDQIFDLTALPGENLSAEDAAKRKEIIAMYRDFGIDLSLDMGSFYSKTLASFRPQSWSSQTKQPLSGAYLQPFSVDAPTNHPIPCYTPHVQLPVGYFSSAQLHFYKGFDGVGFGVAISKGTDPVRTIKSKADGKSYQAHVRNDALELFLPTNTNADQQVIFLDSVDNTLINCIKAKQDGSNYACGFAAQSTLPNLGDRGGTIASGMSNLAGLIREDEATDKTTRLTHGIIIVSNRMWKARVYPAVSGDAWIYKNQNANRYGRGLVPYGGVVQLDPALNLEALNLSLPAKRILEAVQQYGAYLVDSGGPAFGIYTSVKSSEFEQFASIYTPNDDKGIQNQIAKVLSTSKVYVVPPLVKR